VGELAWTSAVVGGGPVKLLEDDVEKVRVGKDKVKELLFCKPREIVVFLRRTVFGLSEKRADQKDAGVEVRAGEAPDEAGVVRTHHDPDLFEKLPGEGIGVRFAEFNVAPGRIPAVWGPQPRGVPVHEQDAFGPDQKAANDVVKPGHDANTCIGRSEEDTQRSKWPYSQRRGRRVMTRRHRPPQVLLVRRRS